MIFEKELRNAYINRWRLCKCVKPKPNIPHPFYNGGHFVVSSCNQCKNRLTHTIPFQYSDRVKYQGQIYRINGVSVKFLHSGYYRPKDALKYVYTSGDNTRLHRTTVIGENKLIRVRYP